MITTATYNRSQQVLLFTDETTKPRSVWKYAARSRHLKEGIVQFNSLETYFDSRGMLLGLDIFLMRSITHIRQYPGTVFEDGLRLAAKTPLAQGAASPWIGANAGDLGRDLDAASYDGILFLEPAFLLHDLLRPMTVSRGYNEDRTRGSSEFRQGFYLDIK
jgi:hypothetical protein